MLPRLHHLRVYVVLSLCCLSSASPFATCNLNVKINQTLHDKGFHGNLTYEVVFVGELMQDGVKKGLPLKGCKLGIEQELPAGVFVNPDELNELRKTHKMNAVAKNRINTEQPAGEASPVRVFTLATVIKYTARLWIPVHARYHHAGPNGGYVKNLIEAPEAFLRCPDKWLDTCDNVESSPTNFLCNGDPEAHCSWKAIPFKLTTKAIEWAVPVGNTHHIYYVALSSLLSVIIGTRFILKEMHLSRINLKDKKE